MDLFGKVWQTWIGMIRNDTDRQTWYGIYGTGEVGLVMADMVCRGWDGCGGVSRGRQGGDTRGAVRWRLAV